jgi:hypothetical protein
MRQFIQVGLYVERDFIFRLGWDEFDKKRFNASELIAQAKFKNKGLVTASKLSSVFHFPMKLLYFLKLFYIKKTFAASLRNLTQFSMGDFFLRSFVKVKFKQRWLVTGKQTSFVRVMDLLRVFEFVRLFLRNFFIFPMAYYQSLKIFGSFLPLFSFSKTLKLRLRTDRIEKSFNSRFYQGFCSVNSFYSVVYFFYAFYQYLRVIRVKFLKLLNLKIFFKPVSKDLVCLLQDLGILIVGSRLFYFFFDYFDWERNTVSVSFAFDDFENLVSMILSNFKFLD